MLQVIPAAEPEPQTGPWSIHTDVFDGPLDLLLYLVRRDGIDLRKLSVSQIADSYLRYLDQMRQLNLSFAADYLVMAATLVHLKSLDLLPRPPRIVEDEEVDPREELARRLEAYEALRVRADALDELPRVKRDVFVREAAFVPQQSAPARTDLSAFGLLDLYWSLLQKSRAPEPKVVLAVEGPDLETCCRRLLAALGGKGGVVELGALLRTIESRGERVITFLASLEMTRLHWLSMEQDHHLAPVFFTQVLDDSEIDITQLVGEERSLDEKQLDLPLGE